MVKRQSVSTIIFLVLLCFVGTRGYGGQVICDGKLSDKTAQATGHLMTVFGFAYLAMGFQAAGEPEQVKALWEIIRPVYRAQRAGQLFQAFIKDKVPANLLELDVAVRRTDYEDLYKGMIAKGVFVPKSPWSEVSSFAAKSGLKGLMEV